MITAGRKEYLRKWQREQRRKFPERYQDYDRKAKIHLKIEVLQHYSPNLLCARCGFNDVRALTLNHLKHDGNKHRRQLGHGNKHNDRVYQWLRKNKYPEGFNVLCMNCQFIEEAEHRQTYRQKWYSELADSSNG